MQWVGWRTGKDGAWPLSRHWRHTHETGSPGMIEIDEDENLTPQGDLALQITALPREANGFGDIYGGWLVAQMDLAGTAMASKVAAGRVATVAIDRMAFLVPVAVGAQLSFYTQTLEIGRSSIQMLVEVWSDDPLSSEWRKVTEAVFVFVAIDGSGRTRPVPQRRG
ncbi:putative acyl-CoA thioester hydrolase [compost metagenome]